MWVSTSRTSTSTSTSNNNKSGCHVHRRRMISPLQGKGVMLLLLVLFTESITLTKAVRTVEAFGGNGGSGASAAASSGGNAFKQQESCTDASSSSSSCSASSNVNSNTSPGLPPIKHALGGLSKRMMGVGNDCCGEFQRCASKYPRALEECVLVPRGGQSAVAGVAAEAAATATAAVTKMPYNIPLNGWKIIFQVFLTTINVACWLIPLKSKSFGENKLALSLANAFSGGVFLSLAFGHLIPECVHGFTSSIGQYNEATPYMLVLGGYLLIFFVEKVAFDAHEILHEMEHAQDNIAAANQNGKKSSNKKNTNNEVAAATAAKNTGRSAVILLAALAVHSILEMMALGLSDSFSDSAILTISIALHQVCFKLRYVLTYLATINNYVAERDVT